MTAKALAGFIEIPLEDIGRDPAQPRKDFDEEALKSLAASIKEVGVREPILVRPRPAGEKGTAYLLTAGERRWRASKLAGKATIRAIVEDLDIKTVRATQLVENLQREDLNALELAQAYVAYRKETGETQAQLAKRLGTDQATVSLQERLLELPAAAHAAIAEGTITRFHARELLRLKGHPERLAGLIKDTKQFEYSSSDLKWRVDNQLRAATYAAKEKARQEREAKAAAKAKKGPRAPAKPKARKKTKWELAEEKRRAQEAVKRALEPFLVRAIEELRPMIQARLIRIRQREIRLTPVVAAFLATGEWFSPAKGWKRSEFEVLIERIILEPLDNRGRGGLFLAAHLWLARDAQTLDQVLRKRAVALQAAAVKKAATVPARKGGRK